jgi:hypothetical protein
MNLPCSPRALRARAAAVFSAAAILVFCPSPLPAQAPGDVTVVAPSEVSAGEPLLIAAELLRAESIEAAYLLYRPLGRSEYTRVDMDLRGSRASVLIPPRDVAPPYLEYYMVLRQRSGALVTHPFSTVTDPLTRPPDQVLRIPVRPAEESSAQALLLSPDPAVPVPPEELVISVSLLRADSSVDLRATRLLVDGTDVTADAVFADDILVYVPENFSRRLSPGEHHITVQLFTADGTLYRSPGYRFLVQGAISGPAEQEQPGARYRVSVQVESRREEVAGSGTWYNRGGFQFTGTSGLVTVRSQGFLTSDEHTDRQPQNRFFIGAAIPWLSVGYGDGYPSFSNLILNGKRVRGLHSSATLGWFNLDVAFGQTERPLEGRLLKTIPVDSLAAEQSADPTAAYTQISAATWAKILPGTFERKVLAVRPSFGSGRTWRLGFTWFKAKDDVPSVRYGVRPQENLVVGSDFVTRLFDEAVELFAEGAFSAFNTDISSGNFTDAYIDSVYPNNASDIKTARDILDNFITVNDNLRPLSLKKLSTVSYDAGVGLNLLSQALRVTWTYRGSDYHSFGQSFLRTDLQGFSAVDRIRLIDNRIFVSLGFERLRDNTSGTKPATTTFTTMDAVLSYYPRTELPSLTLGYGGIRNTNDLPLTGADSIRTLSAIDELGNRVFAQTAYTFTGQARHTISASASVSRRDDRSRRGFDVNDRSLSAGLTTLFPSTFQTTVEFSHNRSERPLRIGGPLEPFSYSTMTFAARYGFIRDVLVIRGAISPTYGDFQRVLLGGGIDWTILPAMTLEFDYSRLKPESGIDDSIVDIRYRYDL